MVMEIIAGALFLYCLYLHTQIKRLKYFADYGSPRCEKNIESLWERAEETQEKTKELSSRMWEVEHRAGMHPPHVQI